MLTYLIILALVLFACGCGFCFGILSYQGLMTNCETNYAKHNKK